MKANNYDENYDDEDGEPKYLSSGATNKRSNILPLWGNERTMNLNPLILTNIQSSHYFKVNLYGLKTYHEVIDEIYYKVQHVEPWEKGSRKTAGQTGMCGGVRGVGAGGIVSTAYCLLYKLFTLKLTRKQLKGLITHPDSPYIRVLGFMYIRYTQPPPDLWDWYDEFLEDTEEVDVKAGGGQVMTIGNILKMFLVKLEWFSTLFPRIPVPIQQKIEKNMSERFPAGITTQKPTQIRHSSEKDYNEVEKPRAKERRSEERRDRGRDSRRRHSPECRAHSSDRRRRHHSRDRHRHTEEKYRDERLEKYRDDRLDKYRDERLDKYRDERLDKYRDERLDKYRDERLDKYRDERPDKYREERRRHRSRSRSRHRHRH